jgi:hypothetical protein
MKNRLLLFLQVVLAVALVLRASVAAAEETSPDRLFADAMALIDEERFAEAIPKLEEAQRLDPGIGTQFNLAACYVKTGRLAEGWRNLVEVERLARVAGKKPREEAARQMMEEIRPRVPHLVVRLGDPQAVTLRVDGRSIPLSEVDFVAVEPGEHHVEASAPAKQPFAARVLVEVTRMEYEVAVPPLVAIEPKTEVRTVTRDRINTKRTLGVAFAGLGVAGIVTATVTGVMILSAKSTADERCKPDCVTLAGDPDVVGNDAVQRGKDLLPINLVAWVVAGVGVVGAAFWLIPPPKATPRKAGQLQLGGSAYRTGGVWTLSTVF